MAFLKNKFSYGQYLRIWKTIGNFRYPEAKLLFKYHYGTWHKHLWHNYGTNNYHDIIK